MIVALILNGLVAGAAIAAIAYAMTRCIPERNAVTRYAIWYAAMLALAVIPTFAIVSDLGARIASPFHASSALHGLSISLLPVVSPVRSAANVWSWAPGVVAAGWIAGTLLTATRLAASFVRIERIRRAARPAEIGGRAVLVSDRLTMPIAAGISKPVVILPAAVVASLATSELELVIAHEDAHIRRGDVRGNFIARCIEALFFFNPWVYVIGRNLVNEREAACDDLAVATAGAANDYAHCLASLAHALRGRRSPLLTPSALGSRNFVVTRIERLLRHGATGITSLNYTYLGGTIVLFAILTLALQAFSPVSASPAHAGAAYSGAQPAVVAAGCTSPNASARVVNAAMPDIPHSAAPPSGFVNIMVAIAPSGSVSKATVAHSSGNPQVDMAVLNAAKTSTYAAAVSNCVPIAGTYLFHAQFAPQ